MNFQNGRKILTLLTFGCPTHDIFYHQAVEDPFSSKLRWLLVYVPCGWNHVERFPYGSIVHPNFRGRAHKLL